MEPAILNAAEMYRLPWTLSDNAISWLEPTSACNLACDGCYRENIPRSHKSLSVIQDEINTFVRLRKCDGISIAGGEPLLHPDIFEIVRRISAAGIKPILNTNGLALTKEMLLELKKAGATGFTFHIDSKQGRPSWKNKTEIELNDLRQMYAEMLADAGGLSCSFNSTVYEDTACYVPDMLEWAAKNINIVHVIVFILYRAAVPQIPFDWYANGKKVDMGILPYSEDSPRRIDMKSTDLVQLIRKRFPGFKPSAYLNGTQQADSYKWLLSGRIGSGEEIYGYVGPKFIELMQTSHHLFKGRWLAYANPSEVAMGRTMLLFSAIDSRLRRIAARYFSDLMFNPSLIFKKLHFQSVMIIQPVDFLENGAQNMCDGCPDITVYNGELVWSCRLEELKKFGCWVQTYPKEQNKDSSKNSG
ncbi:MAG: radical SAM protein [Bacteroidota bacterium]